MKNSSIILHLICPQCGSRRLKNRYAAMTFEDGKVLKLVFADSYNDEAIRTLESEGHRFSCGKLRVCRNCGYWESDSEFDPNTVFLKNEYQCDCGEKEHALLNHDWDTGTLLVECKKCNKQRYVKLPFQL